MAKRKFQPLQFLGNVDDFQNLQIELRQVIAQVIAQGYLIKDTSQVIAKTNNNFTVQF